MTPARALGRVLFGADPKLHRMMRYWAATGVLYSLCIAFIYAQVQAGTAAPNLGMALCYYGAAGIVFFFALVRASFRLGIAPSTLAVAQGLYAISCNMAVYAMAGPLRGAWLLMLLVVMVFCTSSLRPRQALALCASALAGMGATMWYLATSDPLSYPAHTEITHFGLAAASLLAITLLTGEMTKLRTRLKRQKEELLAAVGAIRTLATVDELTSLANRRHMNEVLSAQERRAASGSALCIALLDIDHFKRINDEHGHAAGDAVLRAFAITARSALREADMLARWGGEEFLLMLPDTGLVEASLVLQRMAERVGAMHIPDLALDLRIAFSGGLVERGAAEPFAETIKRADKAMYVAKSSGRNRVVAV